METPSSLDSSSCEDSSLPGEEPSSSALSQALSRILHQLAVDQNTRRTKASQAAALQDLRGLIEAADCEGLFGCDDTLPGGMPSLLGRLARALEKAASPPKEQEGRDEHSGHPDVAERAVAVGTVFLQLLTKVEAAKNHPTCPMWGPGLGHVASSAYVFAVAHSSEHPWTSPGSRDMAREVLAQLLRVAGCASVAGLLVGEREDENGRLKAILALLQPELNKETWKNNPATKHVFSWTLQQVTRPWLNQYLEKVLPPSLLISDDYRTENKILGVQCLHHILLNVAVLLCLLDIFPILEKGQHWKGGTARPTTHCDEVLQLVLTHMQPEHRLLLRRIYARSLPAFVKRLGILTVRHLKRLEQVIIGYLEIYDGPEEEARLKILETLKLLMQYTWPRISCRTVTLLKALLKLICDVAKDPNLTPEPVKSTLLEAATDCLVILDHCSQGQVKGLLAKIPQSCDDGKIMSCIRIVFEDTPYTGT
ncbi:TELO2-interacting protein 2 isoform X2 [Suncus etruscus]|uniref:TELO2-interacting protein 2 isoform X2 n=1 Tax=Suncus etruscus TaxID=109475 RepID=UPI0021102687|nr:TELO2-interacting protein 2 isoform X2 [Suncus etruscus]